MNVPSGTVSRSPHLARAGTKLIEKRHIRNDFNKGVTTQPTVDIECKSNDLRLQCLLHAIFVIQRLADGRSRQGLVLLGALSCHNKKLLAGFMKLTDKSTEEVLQLRRRTVSIFEALFVQTPAALFQGQIWVLVVRVSVLHFCLAEIRKTAIFGVEVIQLFVDLAKWNGQRVDLLVGNTLLKR